MSTVEDKIKFMAMLEDAIASAEESYGIKMDDAHVSGMVAYFNHVRPWATLSSPQVVGLSDEQILDFLVRYTRACDPQDVLDKFKDWQKTQNFTQPSDAFKAAMEEVHIRDAEIAQLKKELEQLKSQQFTPDWKDAPENADEVCVTLHWADKDSKIVKQTILVQEQRPTPVVEVGQVWVHKYMTFDVEIISVDSGIDFIHCEDDTLKTHVNDIDNFLAKFERVQP